MKFLSLIGLTLFLLVSCVPKKDPFIGRWTVDKVNVGFNEGTVTPEMVRQFGAMEKDNVLIINADSLMTLVTAGDTMQFRCSLRGGQVLRDGTPWGWFDEGLIKTETFTPLGSVKVSYKKSNR